MLSGMCMHSGTICPSSYGSLVHRQVRSHDTSPCLLETFRVSNIGERYTKKLSELIFQPDLLCECSPLTNKALYVISTHQRTQRTPAPFELTSNSIATKAVLKLGCWICTWVTSLPRSILGRTGVLGAPHARTQARTRTHGHARTHGHVRTDTHARTHTCALARLCTCTYTSGSLGIKPLDSTPLASIRQQISFLSLLTQSFIGDLKQFLFPSSYFQNNSQTLMMEPVSMNHIAAQKRPALGSE